MGAYVSRQSVPLFQMSRSQLLLCLLLLTDLQGTSYRNLTAAYNQLVRNTIGFRF